MYMGIFVIYFIQSFFQLSFFFLSLLNINQIFFYLQVFTESVFVICLHYNEHYESKPFEHCSMEAFCRGFAFRFSIFKWIQRGAVF